MLCNSLCFMPGTGYFLWPTLYVMREGAEQATFCDPLCMWWERELNRLLFVTHSVLNRLLFVTHSVCDERGSWTGYFLWPTLCWTGYFLWPTLYVMREGAEQATFYDPLSMWWERELNRLLFMAHSVCDERGSWSRKTAGLTGSSQTHQHCFGSFCPDLWLAGYLPVIAL